MNEQTANLIAALETLIALHSDWSQGSAYVRASFVAQNDAAISAARAAIESARKESQ